MAEARIAVSTPKIESQDKDIISCWNEFIKNYRHFLVRKYFRIRNSLRNGMWPTSTNNLVVACGFSFYLLEYEPSYLQLLVSRLHKIANYLPLPEETPRWLKHIFASLSVSVVFFIALMNVRQYMLRMLLSYRGWMYEGIRETSTMTKIWGLTVKFVSGYQLSLYSCQRSLPRMPVPKLCDTIKNVLASLESLCTQEEFQELCNDAKHFESSVGQSLQHLLYLRSWWSPNYVTEWWEKYVYLKSRLPLAINSNYYAMDHFKWNPTSCQVSRAANIVYSLICLKRNIDWEEFQPLFIRNTIPLCMAQYERLFSTVRCPGSKIDELVHYESKQSYHIVVWCQGLFYQVTVYDTTGKILSASHLESLFQQIVDDANLHKESVSGCERNIAALTALPRGEWAEIYSFLINSNINKDNLEIINSAILMVVLFDKTPEDLSERGSLLLHGDGRSIWYDKSINVCIFPDGSCGFNAEHSMADAPAMAHIFEIAFALEILERRYLEDGKVMPPPLRRKQASFKAPRRIIWDITDQLELQVQKAYEFSVKQNMDLDLEISLHDKFGKGVMKKAGVSPDAFIQIALQLAYYKYAGKFCQTYEASATRLYQHGRTETVRSCTKYTCDFIRIAGENHQLLYRDAMNGKGCDRHLFALYIICRAFGYKSKFLESVLQRPWTLSTSQQPQQQFQGDFPDLNLKSFWNMCSPGGGFGPVSDEGYGISYMLPNEHSIYFHVSSKKSCPSTSSKEFTNYIFESLTEMKMLLGSAE